MSELQNSPFSREDGRIKVLLNQLNPHFLYNALSSIQLLITLDPDYASSLIFDFSVHLRACIRALQSDALIPFANELQAVKGYLNIEKIRYADKLVVEYDIRCAAFSVIPLTVQALVENAVQHGIFERGDEGGRVCIRAFETPALYCIEVEDDGLGFDVQTTLRQGALGLHTLQDRLREGLDANLSITSAIGHGTCASVRIPKKAALVKKVEGGL